MKKAFIVSLMAISTIVACKKDKTKPNDSSYSKENMHEYIQRVWYTTSESKTYYDPTNQELYTQNFDPGVRYHFSDSVITRTDLNSPMIKGLYQVSQQNNQDVITFTLKDLPQENYQITSIDDSTMTWQQEKNNQPYTQDGQQKMAAKEVHIIKFHCPCGPH